MSSPTPSLPSAELRDDPDVPIVRTNIYGTSWVLMLIASYGGQPFDFISDPPVYNLTDPQTISAIEQVARYMQEGLIEYSGLLDNNAIFFGGASEDDYISIDILGELSLSSQMGEDEKFESQIVLFPDGIYMPVAFSSGIAHINSQSVYLQECYDWIRTVAQHPELFQGMPARFDQFENPALIAQQGSDIVEFYESLANSLTVPNVLALPGIYGNVPGTEQGAWIKPDFFYHALDNIILNDADIEMELAQAEANIQAYGECADDIDQISQLELGDLFAEDQEAGQAYMRQFVDCAIILVPELQERYSFYYQ